MEPEEEGAPATDPVVWAISVEANAETREQLAYLLSQREIVNQINQRFGALDVGQRAGHVFEWAHELTFNLDAIARNEEVRAQVTTWLGEPHAPDDLRVVAETGEVLQRVQAKVVERIAQRIGSDNGLSDSKYSGMDRLVPSDHLAATDELLDRRLQMPEGLLHERYADARSHLTDRIDSEGVQSAPLSTEQLRDAASDPKQFLHDYVDDNHLRQVLQGAGAAAAAGAVIAGASAVSQHALATGSVSGVDWAATAILAAKAGARQAAVAAAANVISDQAQHQLADGATGAIEQLSSGTLPFAIARGAFDVAVIAHGVASGRLSDAEAASAAAASITRTGSVWACAAAGQTLIPIPVVGAMIGGVVGQYGATMISQGLQIAIAARDLDRQWDAEYEKLVAEVALVEAIAASELVEIRELAEKHHSAFSEFVLPSLSRIESLVGESNPNHVLEELARITGQFGASPVFSTVVEFEAFMLDANAVLHLKLI